MVIKISAWSHKLSSKAAALGKHTPDMFVKSQWQRVSGVSLYYTVYRCVVACVFLAVVIYSVADPGNAESGFSNGAVAYYFKWPVYLTHWGITLCTVQAILGAYLVTKERYLNAGLETIEMKRSLRVYWVLNNCATIAAFAITTIFWLFVFKPDEMEVDLLNLCVHVGNSVLMLLDLLVVSFPIRLIDFYFPLAFSALYVIFNLIYFLAGGTDRKGRTYIYPILDWTKPGKATAVVIGSLLFAMVLHILACALSTIVRRKLSERWHRRQKTIVESRERNLEGFANEIPITDIA